MTRTFDMPRAVFELINQIDTQNKMILTISGI